MYVMNRAYLWISVIGVWLSFAVAMAAPAFAHAHLSKSMPSPGTTVSGLSEVVLTFSEPLEPAFSHIDVRDANGKSVEAGKSAVKDNIMRVPLTPLSAGTYTVNWRVLSVDTHKTQGSFTFKVQP
jgi:methionine-rich copper-binding protein CopC